MEQQLFCCCKIQCLHTSKVHSTIHFAYTKRAGFIDGRGMAYDMSFELGYVYCLFRIGKVQEQLPQKQNIGINGELELYVVHIFDIQLITKSHCVLGLILIISDIGYTPSSLFAVISFSDLPRIKKSAYKYLFAVYNRTKP